VSESAANKSVSSNMTRIASIALKVMIGLSGGVLVLTIFLGVWMRFVFKMPLFGYDEVAFLSAAWLIWLGAVYAEVDGAHVKGGILDMFLKNKKANNFMNWFIKVISLGVGILFTYYAWKFFSWTLIEKKMTPGLHIPEALSTCAVFIGAALITVIIIVSIVRKRK
jgi:TRAP-type C4-dicarboxylate transport system permease small subunit